MTPATIFTKISGGTSPQAIAQIKGNNMNPDLSGTVKFYQTPYGGLLITAEVFHLPVSPDDMSTGFHGMHIHEYGDCTPPFDKTGMHYNPAGQLHPEHAGDLPPLLSNRGYAYSSFYDSRFTIAEIIGKSVIIHSNRDDFTSQPSGDSGDKIGCGTIKQL